MVANLLTMDVQAEESLHPGVAALWLVAVVALVILPWFVYATIAKEVDALDGQVTEAASALAPLIRQERIPSDLVDTARGLLERDGLGLNYLTLRNAHGVVLVSLGDYESLGDFLPATQARRLRGLLYRMSSSDARIALNLDGDTVGYMDFGISSTAALGRAPIRVALAVLVWLAAAWVAWRFFPLALAQWRAWREGPDPVAEGPAALQPSAPTAAAAAAEPLAGSITNPFTDGLDVACLQLDGHGRIRSANLAAQVLLDQPAGMLLGKSVDDVFAFADGNGLQVEGPASRCLRAKAGIDRERLWLQRPGQDALAVEACAAPASGGATMLLWPVAAAAGSQQSTDERASLAELALASLDQPLALVDAQGTVQLVNPAWAALGGHDAEMLVGVPLAWMLPQPFADTELTKSAQMAATFSGPGGSNRGITLKVQPIGEPATAFLLHAGAAGSSTQGAVAGGSQLGLALAQDGLALRLWPLLGPDGAVVAAWADPNWPDGGGLTGVALWQRAAQEDAAAELAGWLVEHSARAFADWRDIGLSPVPVLLPAGAAPLPAIAQAWTAVRDAMQLPAASLMLVLGHDHEQTPKLPAGMGLALVTDFSRPPPAQGYDLLVLSPELVASLPADENARQAALALAAFANQAQRALVAGPVERAEQSEALSRLGIDHCFGPAAGEVMSARAFGRYLARHPPAC